MSKDPKQAFARTLGSSRIKAICANCGSVKREERELRDDGAQVHQTWAVCDDCGCAAVVFADDSGGAAMLFGNKPITNFKRVDKPGWVIPPKPGVTEWFDKDGNMHWEMSKAAAAKI
jgi:hypothetical protein